MCLLPDKNKASFTFRKIECYKVVFLGPLSADPKHQTFRSEFRDFEYRSRKKYRCKDFKKKVRGLVSEGFHSYSTLHTALFNSCPEHYIVLRCKIPAFSWYYESSGAKELCSNRIKVTGWADVTDIAAARNFEDVEWCR